MPEHGWLTLDKPTGISSAKALAQARKLLGLRKAGHIGTLDPMATGVLPIAFGEATKTIPYASGGDKRYRFTVAWGESRDTDDATGTVVRAAAARPTAATIIRALPAFIGEIQQRPPAYSAVHVAGQRAYARARRGETVSLPSRTVTVRALQLLPGADDTEASTFELVCGSGVYVRAIARDLGEQLGCLGYVTMLRRTHVEPFSEARSWTLDKLELCGSIEARRTALLPVALGLGNLPALEVTVEDVRRLRRGLPTNSTARTMPEDVLAWASWRGVPVAIGVISSGRLQPSRVFNLPEGQQE